jgi:hypothetical protein
MIPVNDRTTIYEKYQNKWIALSDDEQVISDGASLDEALDKAIKKGHKNPFVIRVPDLSYDYLL